MALALGWKFILFARYIKWLFQTLFAPRLIIIYKVNVLVCRFKCWVCYSHPLSLNWTVGCLFVGKASLTQYEVMSVHSYGINSQIRLKIHPPRLTSYEILLIKRACHNKASHVIISITRKTFQTTPRLSKWFHMMRYCIPSSREPYQPFLPGRFATGNQHFRRNHHNTAAICVATGLGDPLFGLTMSHYMHANRRPIYLVTCQTISVRFLSIAEQVSTVCYHWVRPWSTKMNCGPSFSKIISYI